MKRWTVLNEKLMNASEWECRDLLDKEKKKKPPSLTYLLRIYGRYNRLRTIRERNELLGG